MEKEKHPIPLKTMDRFTAWVLLQKIVAKLQQMGMLEKKSEKSMAFGFIKKKAVVNTVVNKNQGE